MRDSIKLNATFEVMRKHPVDENIAGDTWGFEVEDSIITTVYPGGLAERCGMKSGWTLETEISEDDSPCELSLSLPSVPSSSYR